MMQSYQPVGITYYQTENSIDFNLRNVPKDIMIPLSLALAREYQHQLSLSTDPGFRADRALFKQNVIEASKERGLEINPKQLSIGF